MTMSEVMKDRYALSGKNSTVKGDVVEKKRIFAPPPPPLSYPHYKVMRPQVKEYLLLHIKSLLPGSLRG